MGYEPDVALGMLMVSCAPGGGDSNAFSYLVDGEVPLSIAMTFFSTLLAIGHFKKIFFSEFFDLTSSFFSSSSGEHSIYTNCGKLD